MAARRGHPVAAARRVAPPPDVGLTMPHNCRSPGLTAGKRHDEIHPDFSAALTQKVQFLSNPASHPQRPDKIETRETHMSWVFIADDWVLKLKKPVSRSHLDFSTVEARKFFCEEELRLNRRLARETYRAVKPLYCDDGGTLTFEKTAHVIDWLVEMRRLPADEMLDARIAANRVSPAEMARITDRLARFYIGCPPEIADGSAYIWHLLEEHEINRELLVRSEFELSGVAALLDGVGVGLGEMRGAIESRIARGRIVEGHGDLRPEHVCLVSPPQIIDCLEFNRSMRIIDPYDEIGYLALECEVLGADWIRPLLLSALERELGDRPDDRLLALYGGFRALLRARLCLAHLLENPVREPKKWRPLALAYLTQARRHLSVIVA
ncbi:hypothetical protein I6F26_30545 [Ensifer sp. IC3342]|nr:hypothetical protein [Ensifer sp. BRP08]MCA1450847.1 hypothetical protein [Ensifer sp. IC3342]